MKKIVIVLIALCFVISCAGDSAREVQQYTIEQFYKNTNIFGGSFSPDNSKLLVSSNQSGIYNVFSLDATSGESTQLTNSENESFFALSYVPNGDGFLYNADQGGDENDHIYWVNAAGETMDLTPFEGAKSQYYGWSRDHESMYFGSNKRNPRYFDLYEKRIDQFGDPEAYTMVYQNDEGLNVGSVSPNKRYMALTKSITTSNNELYLVDTESGELTHISEHEGDATYSAQFFDMDSENLYLLTNEGSEFQYLARHNIANGERETVLAVDWDIWYAYRSYNEKYQVVGINQDAKTVLQVTDLESGEAVQLPEIDGGSISSVSISQDESQMRLTVSTSASPSNIYSYDIASGNLNKLTNTLNAEINLDDMVHGEVIRYKSFDGLDIPAVYYQPHQASSYNKVPALVWVHGGPGGQSRVGYFALIQYLVNKGYAILAVNNRGSSGYGKTFHQMDDQKHGDVDLKDCVEAKKFFESTGVIDMDKVGIIGGSYGGYMVMAALTYTPEEFAVGVNIFGVTNWLRTLKSIPPYWESFREALYAEMGDPTTADSVRLYNISPLFHADKVAKPLMVLQGANDPRVLQVESDEIVEAVRTNGVFVEYVLFDDEGHGFVKKENEIEGYGKIGTFLDAHLAKTAAQ